MNLASVVHYLEDGAPTSLAENWDNVGLLIEPSPPHTVHKVLITNDLTLDVCEEAVSTKTDLILSYHPPIFSSLKRLTQKSVKEKIVVKCIENRIAVYSPHTVYDTVKDGVNQWILDSFKAFDIKNANPIHQKFSSAASTFTHQVTLRLSPKADLLISNIRDILVPDQNEEKIRNVIMITKCEDANREEEHLLMNLRVTAGQLKDLIELLEDYPGVMETCHVTEMEKLPMPGYGAGLVAGIGKEMTLKSAIECVKTHMKLDHVRLALGREQSKDGSVSSIAVCAGSGRSVLAGVKADLYVTGEMSHHDILACTETGVNVILTEHSNCERGFLSVLKDRLEKQFDQTDVVFSVSTKDKDPVSIV